MKMSIIAASFSLLSTISLSAQESNFQKFKKLSSSEKLWVITHPFVAKKALKVSQETLKLINIIKQDPLLDCDISGGQVDAFRHCYWMARLTQEMRWRKAYKLGKAHEQGNKRDYKKHRLEEGNLPDAKTCEMDLLNNKIGINIGKANQTTSQEDLTLLIKQHIIDGKLWKIKKDSQGRFLYCDGNILQKKDYQGIWENSKCLVAS